MYEMWKTNTGRWNLRLPVESGKPGGRRAAARQPAIPEPANGAAAVPKPANRAAAVPKPAARWAAAVPEPANGAAAIPKPAIWRPAVL